MVINKQITIAIDRTCNSNKPTHYVHLYISGLKLQHRTTKKRMRVVRFRLLRGVQSESEDHRIFVMNPKTRSWLAITRPPTTTQEKQAICLGGEHHLLHPSYFITIISISILEIQEQPRQHTTCQTFPERRAISIATTELALTGFCNYRSCCWLVDLALMIFYTN